MSAQRTKARVQTTLPLSFRVAPDQVEEIDREVARDHRKDRVSLLEPIWNWAWQVYKRVGSVRVLLEGTTVRRLTDRVDHETQERLYSALETIFDRAPTGVVDEVSRLLSNRAGKYGEPR
jgi:hypothetical protein